MTDTLHSTNPRPPRAMGPKARRVQLIESTIETLASCGSARTTLSAVARAGDDPAEQLNALIEADFNPAIGTPARLADWCSFWSEAQSRPLCQETCGHKDDACYLRLEEIWRRLSDLGG